MTNEQIITTESIELMKAGIIGTTGRIIKVQLPDGSRMEVAEPEQIHTFQCWKSLGYQVKRGSKAVAKIKIWKYVSKYAPIKAKDEVGEEIEVPCNDEKMFLKESAFFSQSQVEAITKA